MIDMGDDGQVPDVGRIQRGVRVINLGSWHNRERSRVRKAESGWFGLERRAQNSVGC